MDTNHSRTNVFSVDVEDYFHASALADGVRSVGLENLEHRVVSNTVRVLDVLDMAETKGTFFVLGWVTERYPELVREIQSRGHEVACHGYSHSIVYEQSPDEFRRETLKAKKLLEDTIGERVIGYRAASFSITKNSLWALDIHAETGFLYDSSVFPAHHDRYGIPDAALEPHRIALQSGASIVEVPMSVTRFFGLNIPVSGGGYFRLYPYWFSRLAGKAVQAKQRPWVFYVHPWEVDTDQPRLDVGLLSKFRHYNNLQRTEGRLKRLLEDFNFEPMRSYLESCGFLHVAESHGLRSATTPAVS
jgi:polysaccharide deacetylase family protein (PEP-CTERM system associated)